jgi:hypothetical protein
MSQQRLAHKRWCDAQGASILDGGHVDHIEVDRTDRTPPLSTGVHNRPASTAS